MEIKYRSIGLIHSPFKETRGMPIQTTGAKGTTGTVEVYAEYADGLKDLEDFSHIILLYHFHRSAGHSLMVKPFMDDAQHGVFATRAPKRPNSIGLSVVKLMKIEGNILYIENVDMVDGTPLLDIKPYVPEFDIKEVERTGWLSTNSKKVYKAKADERFR